MSTTTPSLTERLLRSAAVSATLLAGLSNSANAAGANAQISGNGFGLSVIKVVSENGTSWTKIEKGDYALPVKIQIGMPGLSVVNYNVRQLGMPEGQYIGIGRATSTRLVDLATVYKGDTDYLSAAERQDIIASCNGNLGNGKGIHESHHLFAAVGVELRAWFVNEAPPTAIGGQDAAARVTDICRRAAWP